MVTATLCVAVVADGGGGGAVLLSPPSCGEGAEVGIMVCAIDDDTFAVACALDQSVIHSTSAHKAKAAINVDGGRRARRCRNISETHAPPHSRKKTTGVPTASAKSAR